MQCGHYVLTNLVEKWKTILNLYRHGTGLRGGWWHYRTASHIWICQYHKCSAI